MGAVAAAETEKSFTIPSAWRAKAGFVRFYLMANVPPYDTRLESLRVPSAGAYIDTGFVPNTNSDIRVKAYHPGDMAPFGVSGKCYLFCNSPVSYATANYFFGFFGASGNTSAAPRGTAPHVHKINAKGAYVDGICYYAFDPASLTTTTTSTLTLFARKNDSNTTVGKQGDCTIYWAQLRQNGTLEHDYVPCVKDGVATLYDRAKGTFCTVKGNGAFTAGAEIGPDAQDCGGVESATDALALGPALAIDSVDVGLAEVTVAFTGDEGVLYAVADTADRGTSVSAWANIHFLGKVAADATTATFAIPGTWIANGYQMRFLWRSAADFPYDREVEWLYSAGLGLRQERVEYLPVRVDLLFLLLPQRRLEVLLRFLRDSGQLHGGWLQSRHRVPHLHAGSRGGGDRRHAAGRLLGAGDDLHENDLRLPDFLPARLRRR